MNCGTFEFLTCQACEREAFLKVVVNGESPFLLIRIDEGQDQAGRERFEQRLVDEAVGFRECIA